jgi:hypothetical protein
MRAALLMLWEATVSIQPAAPTPLLLIRVFCPSPDHHPVGPWSSGQFGDQISQRQLPDPDLGIMYTTPCPIVFAGDASNNVSNSVTNHSESSGFHPHADSVMSSYFTEPATPASLSSEPLVKKSHSRRRPPGHIPRPRNAFILFRMHYVAAQLIPGKVEVRSGLAG